MALEPDLVTADAAPNPELADMTRRFWIASALALPVLLLEMGGPMLPAMAATIRCQATVSLTLTALRRDTLHGLA